MNGERTITFSSGGRYLTIELHERPFPNADHASWDRGAINAIVIGLAGPFRVTFATLVWDNDIVYLLQTLKKLSKMVGQETSETVTFGGYEELVEVIFGLDKRGSLYIRATLIDDPLTTAKLWFDIEADQSYLAGWIDNVENIVGSLGK